jgi:hypothetical protein
MKPPFKQILDLNNKRPTENVFKAKLGTIGISQHSDDREAKRVIGVG